MCSVHEVSQVSRVITRDSPADGRRARGFNPLPFCRRLNIYTTCKQNLCNSKTFYRNTSLSDYM